MPRSINREALTGFNEEIIIDPNVDSATRKEDLHPSVEQVFENPLSELPEEIVESQSPGNLLNNSDGNTNPIDSSSESLEALRMPAPVVPERRKRQSATMPVEILSRRRSKIHGPNFARQQSILTTLRKTIANPEATAHELHHEQMHASCHDMMIIHPYSVFRRYWDVFIMSLLFYLCLVVPYRIAFNQDAYGGMLFFDRFVDMVFILDIFLNFHTGYNQGSLVILDRRKIAIYYLRTFFIIDVVSGFPLDYVFSGDTGSEEDSGEGSVLRTSKILKVFKLLRLLKLFRVLRMNRILSRMETKLSIKYGLLKCLKFSVFIVYSAHMLACAFAYTASFHEPNWMNTTCNSDDICLSSQPVADQYIAAVYWAVTTMSTIGYGDITAATTEERIVSLFCMCVGAVIFAYGLTNMCTLVANMNMSDVIFRERMDSLHEFFEYRDLPHRLRGRVREFFHYKRNSDMLYEQEPALLAQMSSGLRHEILLHINCDMIQRISFLKEAADMQMVAETVELLTRDAAGPKELIVRQGDPGNEMFFITSGTLHVFSDGRYMDDLGESDVFGEVALIYRIPRMASVWSSTFVDLYVLKRVDYEKLINMHPEMLHSIIQLARTRLVKAGRRKIWYGVRMLTMIRMLAGDHWSPACLGDKGSGNLGTVNEDEETGSSVGDPPESGDWTSFSNPRFDVGEDRALNKQQRDLEEYNEWMSDTPATLENGVNRSQSDEDPESARAPQSFKKFAQKVKFTSMLSRLVGDKHGENSSSSKSGSGKHGMRRKTSERSIPGDLKSQASLVSLHDEHYEDMDTYLKKGRSNSVATTPRNDASGDRHGTPKSGSNHSDHHKRGLLSSAKKRNRPAKRVSLLAGESSGEKWLEISRLASVSMKNGMKLDEEDMERMTHRNRRKSFLIEAKKSDGEVFLAQLVQMQTHLSQCLTQLSDIATEVRNDPRGSTALRMRTFDSVRHVIEEMKTAISKT